MGRQFTPLVARMARRASRKACAFPVGAVLFGIASVFAVFVWVISVTPPLLSAALTLAIAIAWCIWLEGHPVAAEARKQCRHDPGSSPLPTRLSVHVLASTSEGTKCASATAKCLTHGVEVGEKAASYRAREGLEPALMPERVMVCMSSNTLAPRVLRTGARIAGRLGSKWYAVYVETPSEKPGHINPRDAEALQQNIELAESLGATVVRVRADGPSDGLVAFAQREGVTHVISARVHVPAGNRSGVVRRWTGFSGLFPMRPSRWCL
jgi:hypothetical protein